jgi:hypothetical protein
MTKDIPPEGRQDIRYPMSERGKLSDANLDFVPVEIRGELLSSTILRERR